MSISDDEYASWLRADKPRCVLAELTRYVAGTGEVVAYLSNWPYVSTPTDTPANQVYDDLIAELPAFSASLPEMGIGRSTFAWGDLGLLNLNGALDEWLGDGWDGRAYTLRLGDPSWPRGDFRVIVAGSIDDIVASARDRMTIKLRDKSGALNVSIQTTLIGGTTANKDQPVPLALGECFNVEPILTDAATHTYQGHDGACNAISAVRENGMAIANTPNLAAGTTALGVGAVGRITADIQGAKPAGVYLTKCADLVSYIVTTRTTLTSADLHAASFSAMNTTCPQTLGLFIRSRMNVMEAIDRLVAAVGGWWAFDRQGLLRLGRLDAPSGTPVLELTADDLVDREIRVVRRTLPVKTVRLGWQTNWTPQPDGIAGGVTEANRALYAAAEQVASASNAGVSTKHLLAPSPDVVSTCIAGAADGAAEATRRAALFNQVRGTYGITVIGSANAVSLGDVIRLTHAHYGFSGGPLAVVVGIKDRSLENRVELAIWK